LLHLARYAITETVFLSGLYFKPFQNPNAASLTLSKHISPSTMMTGNTIRFGINLPDYLSTGTLKTSKI
jgi:uncharacterized membrane protein YoaK (UPF0700 family)